MTFKITQRRKMTGGKDLGGLSSSLLSAEVKALCSCQPRAQSFTSIVEDLLLVM